jgi:hypothetical protein
MNALIASLFGAGRTYLMIEEEKEIYMRDGVKHYLLHSGAYMNIVDGTYQTQ